MEWYLSWVSASVLFFAIFVLVAYAHNIIIRHVKCHHGNYLIASSNTKKKTYVDSNGTLRYPCCCPWDGRNMIDHKGPWADYVPGPLNGFLVALGLIPVAGAAAMVLAIIVYSGFTLAACYQHKDNEKIILSLLRKYHIRMIGGFIVYLVVIPVYACKKSKWFSLGRTKDVDREDD